MADEKKIETETEKSAEETTTAKKPAVRGKRLTTGLRGGLRDDESCGGQSTSSTGWGCTNHCNHAARVR